MQLISKTSFDIPKDKQKERYFYKTYSFDRIELPLKSVAYGFDGLNLETKDFRFDETDNLK